MIDQSNIHLCGVHHLMKLSLSFQTNFLDHELNICDKILANNMVEEKHFILCWYLYDKKVSHVKDEVCEEIVAKLYEHSG